MQNHCSRVPRLVTTVLAASLVQAPAHAGGVTGSATEWTQLANNSELVGLLESSGTQVENQMRQITQLAEQIRNQLSIYQNMLQNTARLPQQTWGQVENDLRQLQAVVRQGQGIAFSMGNADDILRQRFKAYGELKTSLAAGESFSTTYQGWSDTNRDTIAATLRAASLTSDQFATEEAAMASVRSMSGTADGQLKALQVGHQIAAQQVAQMQKLRGLVSQQITMIGTWYQSEQTDKDLAQARREKFFNAPVKPIADGQKMEPRW
jgi:P-type conjugative transfer protein TrbJ